MDDSLIHNPQEFDAEKLEGYRCLTKAEFDSLEAGANEPFIEFFDARTRIWTACKYPNSHFGAARGATYRTKMPDGYFLKTKEQRKGIEAALADAGIRVKDCAEALRDALGALPAFKQGGETLPNGGLTKREYFAAAAMQGLNANPSLAGNVHSLAKVAVKQADALLAELERREEADK